MAARSSSAAGLAAAAQALAGGEHGESRAMSALRHRADEARVQQLRGVFAAYDADGDGRVTPEQLHLALLALGLQPVPSLTNLFLTTVPAIGGGREGEALDEDDAVDLQTVSVRLGAAGLPRGEVGEGGGVLASWMGSSTPAALLLPASSTFLHPRLPLLPAVCAHHHAGGA